MNIDYGKIAKSVEYYSKKDFVVIDAPWWVSEEISNITKPENLVNFSVVNNGKVLVASGEQSFLSLISKGRLPEGSYQATTPCFRDEHNEWLHRKYFIKNELIDTKNVNEGRLGQIIDIAVGFFKIFLQESVIKIVKTNDKFNGTLISYDIMFNDIEIGSYGIREYMGYKWIYATGCAEPRLSLAESIMNEKIKKQSAITCPFCYGEWPDCDCSTC